MKPPIAEDVTIAVTVFDRRDYLLQSVGSAVVQTVPVKVMVVEDAGPDPGLRRMVEESFGARVHYRRNPRRRGLFDNWNACLEACETRWISILHDDDWLEPGFVAAMLELAGRAPGLGLYYGQTRLVNEAGTPIPPEPAPFDEAWKPMDLEAAAVASPFPYPGQLFPVEAARALGGFPPNSYFTGDWEMWFLLGLRFGAAQTNRVVANFRKHHGPGRGTTRVERRGDVYGRVAVQQKRNLARLPVHEARPTYDRTHPPWGASWVSTLLLRNGTGMSPRLLRYNRGLLLHCPPARNWMYVYRLWVRLAGLWGIRLTSCLWRWFDARAAKTGRT